MTPSQEGRAFQTQGNPCEDTSVGTQQERARGTRKEARQPQLTRAQGHVGSEGIGLSCRKDFGALIHFHLTGLL